MGRADEIRAELDVLDLEEKLVTAKKAGKDYTELKQQLREARRAFRERREGGAVVSPEPVKAKVKEG